MSSTRGRPTEIERERLIEANLSLARYVARRYAGRGAELDDLVQVGALGLVKAADCFDPDRGVAFTTFAIPRIEGEIRHHLRDQTSSLRIPRELQRMSRRLRRAQSELTATLGRSPTVTELAQALDADEHEIERALVAERARDAIPLSFEEPPDSAVADELLTISEDKLLLADGVRTLDERERRIVYLRFHADMTERQIADEVGISQAHVSRLLTGALTKLRTELGTASEDETGGDTAEKKVISHQSDARNGSFKSQMRNQRTIKEADGKIAGVGAPESDAKHSERGGRPSTRKGHASHSGRFLVRMPSKLHEQLAQAAEREQVSLNRFVTDTLAASVGTAHDVAPDGGLASERSGGSGHEHASGRAANGSAATNGVLAADAKRSPARTFRIALAANLVVVAFAAAVAVVLLVLALQRGI